MTDENIESTSSEVQKPSKSSTKTTTWGLSASEEEEYLLKQGRVSFRLALITFIVTLGSSFQCGYNIGVVNTPDTFIKHWIYSSHKYLFGNDLSDNSVQTAFVVAVSIFAIGGLIGGLLLGFSADKFGRKRTLELNNILGIFAGAFMYVSTLNFINCYPLFIMGRLLIGINAGISSGLVPMYLTELSPIKFRGMFGSLSQLVTTITILLAQVLGLPYILGTADKWPFMFAIIIVPGIAQAIGLIFVPESPRYTLLYRANREKAMADLLKLRDTDLEYTKLEIKAFDNENTNFSQGTKLSMLQLFASRQLRWSLSLAVLLMVAQQMSGINAVMFYSKSMFEGAGLNGLNALYASCGVGLLNVLVTCLSIWLVDHRLFGRRHLLCFGNIGMCGALTALFTSITLMKENVDTNVMPYLSILFINLFVFCFALGMGSIPLFIVSEIFDSEARGSANSIAIASNWFFNFIVSLCFPLLNSVIGQYTFLIFAVICLAFFIFVLIFLPETKGKSVNVVQEEINRRQPRCFN